MFSGGGEGGRGKSPAPDRGYIHERVKANLSRQLRKCEVSWLKNFIRSGIFDDCSPANCELVNGQDGVMQDRKYGKVFCS